VCRRCLIALTAASTAVRFVHARHRDLSLLEVAGDQTRAKTDLARSLVYLSKGPTWLEYPSAPTNDPGRDLSSAPSREPSAVRDCERRVGDWVRAHNQSPPTPADLGVPPGGRQELPGRPPADDAARETGNREASQVTCQSSMGRLFPRAPEMTLHDHLLVSADGHSRCVPVAMNVPGVLRRRQGTRSLLSASEMTVVPTRTVDVRQRVSAMVGDRRALATRHLREGS